MDQNVLDTLRIPAAEDRPPYFIANDEATEEETASATPMQKNSRSDQSKINGAKSKGPITEEGRNKCSRSALKHGLCSEKHTVLDIEDQSEFDEFLKITLDYFRPTTL